MLAMLDVSSVMSELDCENERNLLRDVWEEPRRSAAFPRSVWRFLAQPLPGPDDALMMVREALVARWRSADLFGAPGSETQRRRIALITGAGGIYGIDGLSVRDAVLDLLEAAVATTHQEIELLLYELTKAGSASRPR